MIPLWIAEIQWEGFKDIETISAKDYTIRFSFPVLFADQNNDHRYHGNKQ